MNARALAVAAAFAAAAASQVDPATPPAPVVPRPAVPQGVPGQQPGTAGQGPTTLPPQREPLNSTWVQPTQPPRFQGFPVFPSRLQGLGLYPNAANPGQPGAAGLSADLLRLPPPEQTDPGWPAWARTAARAPLPFAPDLALLVRNGDRVWYSTEPEEPFVPLFFHDKLRTLRGGAVVEVRHAGEFELLLHTSSRLSCRGPTRVELLELTAEVVKLAIPVQSHWRLVASSTVATAPPADAAAPPAPTLFGAPVPPAAADTARAHSVRLPDGSTVAFGHDDATRGPVDLICERADEPAWYGGRATLTNFGQTPVVWRHHSGEVTVPPGTRVTFFLQPPRWFVGTPLVTKGVKKAEQGEASTFGTDGDGTVEWCGARFSVPPGGSVRLDPQLGPLVAPAVPAAKAVPPQPGK